jgi:serine/threonine-protein kinase HipA
MKFAGRLGLETAETSLIKLKDGNDAFITRRFDRDRQGEKQHAEDFAQATGLTRDTESEYHGSMELMAKVIRQSPMRYEDKKLALQRLLKSTLFNYLVGNCKQKVPTSNEAKIRRNRINASSTSRHGTLTERTWKPRERPGS